MSTFFTFETEYRLIRIDQSTRRLTAMHTVQWQNAVIQQSIVSERRFSRQRSTIGLIAEIFNIADRAVSAEQSHAQLWLNNATRLSGRDSLRVQPSGYLV